MTSPENCAHTVPELLERLQIGGPANLVPALVCEPGGGGVCKLVLQTHTPRQEEHELIPVQLLLRSVYRKQGGQGTGYRVMGGGGCNDQ